MSTLFALGSNGSGQLGIGHDDDVNIPTKIIWSHGSPLQRYKVKQISAGGNHTLILLDSGQIYWSGDNSDGRCFHQPLHSSNTPRLVEFEHELAECKVSLCICTWEASIAVLENGRIVSSGSGNRGELGLGPDVSRSSGVQLLEDFAPSGTTVAHLAASMNHIVAVMSNGEVYAWGAGRRGQFAGRKSDSWRPQKIVDIPFAVQRAVVGTNFTYLIGPLEAPNGIFLGLDKYGLLAVDSHRIKALKDVASSWGSLHFLLTSGKVVSYGRDDHAQLVPAGLSSITAIAAGSEHVVCISEIGQVMAWGWGEHGNCGVNVDSKTFDSHGSSLPVAGRAIFIAAGCATTWICAEVPSP